ncbi:MAG: hypothetical protein IKG85_08990 [Clostridia bacterium]|nr:hypothetical protein [Clostridia bacterium]
MAGSEKQKDKKKSNRIIGRRFRYTEDYKSVPTLNSSGGRENTLVYTGQWILPVNEQSEYKRIVLVMRAALAAAVLFVLGAAYSVPVPMANRWYLPVLLVALFPLAYQIMGAVKLPNAPKHMERVQYDKSFVRVGQSAVITLIVLGVSALLFIVYWAAAAAGSMEEASPFTARDAAYAVLIVLAAAAEFVIFRRYRGVKTETLDNSAYRP